MSLEAIEKVAQVERETQERRAAAEAEARQILSGAERDGLALLQQTRSAAAEEGKNLLRQAEEKAAAAAAADLQKKAKSHLEEAAEFIVGRVVKH